MEHRLKVEVKGYEVKETEIKSLTIADCYMLKIAISHFCKFHTLIGDIDA